MLFLAWNDDSHLTCRARGTLRKRASPAREASLTSTLALMTNELAINKRQGQKVECACRECHRTTKHEIVTEATLSGASGHHDFEIYWATEYQVVRCLGCETLLFRRTNSNSEDGYIQVGPDEWEENIHEELFPSRHEGRQPVSDVDLLPDKIQRIYEETLGNDRGQTTVSLRSIKKTVVCPLLITRPTPAPTDFEARA